MCNPCEAPCAKCGSQDINRRFYTAGDRIAVMYGKPTPKSVYVKWTSTRQGKVLAECINHHCRTCQYAWFGPTLEATREQMAGVKS